jgi:hypothetical protein
MLTYYIYTKGEHPFGKGIVQQMINLHEARGPGNSRGLSILAREEGWKTGKNRKCSNLSKTRIRKIYRQKIRESYKI